MQNVWIWTKRVLIILVIICLIILSLLVFNKSGALLSLIETMKDSFKKQTKVIDDLNKEEKDKQSSNQQKYEEEIKKIEEKYKNQQKQLSEKEIQMIKEKIEEYDGDLNKLNEEIKKRFGLN